jgi:hypothetical protein
MAMHEVRDLINEPAIREPLMSEPGDKWHRACAAIDLLQQGGPLGDRIDAANTLGAEAGVPALAATASEADVTSTIAAIEAGLDQRHQSLRRNFAQRALSPAFAASDLSYAIQKVCGVTSGDGGDRAMALGGADVLEKVFSSMRDGMNERGYSGDDETRTALYVVDRVRAFAGGLPGAPFAADLDVMTADALPHVVSRLRELARDIDADDSSY